MASTPLDPVRVPIINLTGEEIDDIREQITAGLLPSDFLEKHKDAVARNVFGHDARRDAKGNYVEQGMGAKGHETANHFAAMKKAEAMGLELPGAYDKAVAEIWKRDPDRAQKLGLPGRR